jgi:glycosyltransferase involved in cell wall biosynthesis
VRRIGLFLDVESTSGGVFQYSRAILDACAALPPDEFTLVVAYSSEDWVRYLESSHISGAIRVYPARWARLLGKAWALVGLPNSLWRWVARYFGATEKCLIRQKCDLWIFPAQDAWTYQMEVPALGVVHDLMHRYERQFPEVSALGRYRIREYHLSHLCGRSEAVLADSRVGSQHVHESYGVPFDRIHALPYTASQCFYDAIPVLGFDERYKLPQKFLFYPAQFWKHKNHLRLISAVAKVAQLHPDITLVLVGSKKNGYHEALHHARALSVERNVLFMGFVPDADLPEFYRRARALIMPTFFGPTNIPPLEAFASGCPVGVSGIYGIPEQVGDAALLFDPSSIEEIAVCVEKLWANDELCASLSAKGKAYSETWGPTQFNQTLLEIVRRVTSVTAVVDAPGASGDIG